MAATVFTEALHPCAFIVSEAASYQSRDAVTIATSQTIVVGQVLGASGVPGSETSAVTYGAGNTGNFTLGAVTIGAAALDGAYVGVMLTAGATAVFELQGPDGTVVGEGKIGTAFSGPISFTITAGGTAAVVGDAFTVTIAQALTAKLYKAWTPGATDGSQIAVGIAAYPVTTTLATAKIMVLSRRAEVRQTDLTFASGATNAQIAEAVVQLDKRGITMR